MDRRRVARPRRLSGAPRRDHGAAEPWADTLVGRELGKHGVEDFLESKSVDLTSVTGRLVRGRTVARGPRVCSAVMAGGEVVLVDLVKRFADVTAVAGINLDDALGRVLLAARPLGLRQDDHAPADRRVRTAGRGPDPARRRGHGADAAAQAQRQHGLPELRAVPAPHGRGERRVRPALPGRLEAGGEDEGGRRARARPAPGLERGAPRSSRAASSSGSRSRGR